MMTVEPMEFSRTGDRHFSALVARFPRARREGRLMAEARIDDGRFETVRTALCIYLSACLGLRRTELDENALKAHLVRARGTLPNLGPTGQIIPMREHVLEFNMLHRALAAAFQDWRLRDSVDVVDRPFSVRAIFGEVNPHVPVRPHAADKPHTDVWAGTPPDAMVAMLPVLGDLGDIGLEVAELPQPEELRWMRRLEDFSEGKDAPLAVPFHDARLQTGNLYVLDARGLHRTLRKRSSGVLVNIDFRFRLRGNDAYRRMGSQNGRAWAMERAVPYPQWLQTGERSLMVFGETMAEAAATGRTAREGPDDGTEYRLAALET